MRHYAILLLIAMLYLLSACESGTELSEDATVLDHFSKDEAKDLEYIHDFFIEQICESMDCETANASDNYGQFMSEMQESGRTGTYRYWIPVEAIREMIKDLKTDVFDEIWIIDSVTDPDSEMTHETLNFNVSDSKYIHFLESFGATDKTIESYAADVRNVGHISASIVAKMLNSPNTWDTTDVKVRLVIAIHYITAYYELESS